VVEACRRATRLPIDVHLMIENAERYLDAFADAGASSISVHVEALPHLQRAVDHLRRLGLRPGVALNPSTPLGTLEEILPDLDFVLVMSVNPGFAGQKLLPSCLDKIRRLHATIRERRLPARIQVDGGVHGGNIKSVVESGAEIVVAGAAAFAGGDPEAAARALIAAAG
jgi:ribulose-phosphate 3-epimerase